MYSNFAILDPHVLCSTILVVSKLAESLGLRLHTLVFPPSTLNLLNWPPSSCSSNNDLPPPSSFFTIVHDTSLNPKAHKSYNHIISLNPSVSSAASTATAQSLSSHPSSSTTPSFSPLPPSSPLSSALSVTQSLRHVSLSSLPFSHQCYALVSVNPFNLSFASSIDSRISSPRFGRPSLRHCPVLSIANR